MKETTQGMPKKFSLEKYINIFLIIILIILPIVYYLLFVQNNYSQIKAITRNISQCVNEINYLKQRLTLLESYHEKVSQISAQNLEKLNQALPNQPEVHNLFVNIEALAQLSGLELINVSAQPEDVVADSTKGTMKVNGAQGEISEFRLFKVSINTSFEGGGYSSLKKLIEAVENNLRFLRVKSIIFSPSEGNISLRLETYYLGS